MLHVLTQPKGTANLQTGLLARFVSNYDISNLAIDFPTYKGKDIITAKWKVDEVVTKRPAKGTWEGETPDYYECKMSLVNPEDLLIPA